MKYLLSMDQLKNKNQEGLSHECRERVNPLKKIKGIKKELLKMP